MDEIKYLDFSGAQSIITETKTRLAEKQDIIQVTVLPEASAGVLGKVYQYVGITTQDNTHGYFYECVFDGTDYEWVNIPVQDEGEGQIIQVDILPTAEATIEGTIYQYVGTTTQDYTNGFFYKCVNDNGTYKWENIPVQVDENDKIQYEAMPTAEVGNLNKIVQYVGTTTQDYTKGYFYICSFDGTNYEWVQINVQDEGSDSIQVTTLPTADATTLGQVLQYIGATGSGLEHGHFYECVFNDPNYEWVEIGVSDGDTIQFSTLPTASAALVGKVYQYVGATNQNYTHNYFYECVSNGTVPPTYSWQQTDVQPSVSIATPDIVGIVKPDNITTYVNGIGEIRGRVWAGTLAEYAQVRALIPNDTVVIITDYDIVPPATGDIIINGVKIVPFATGTNAELADMLAGHDQGKINIYDFWKVGDVRRADISALSSGWDSGSGEGYAADSAYITLIDDEYGNNDIHYVFALTTGGKTLSGYEGYMNSTDTNAGGWKDSARRYWCNNVLYNGIDSGFKSLMKQFDVLTPESASSIVTTSDYLALIAFTEQYGTVQSHGDLIYSIEQTTLSQFKIFADGTWDKGKVYVGARYRSPVPNSNTSFSDCLSWKTGRSTGTPASATTPGYFVTFGCI